jgi:hypothetical protein
MTTKKPVSVDTWLKSAFLGDTHIGDAERGTRLHQAIEKGEVEIIHGGDLIHGAPFPDVIYYEESGKMTVADFKSIDYAPIEERIINWQMRAYQSAIPLDNDVPRDLTATGRHKPSHNRKRKT